MITFRLTGRVSKDGKLQLRLPEGIPPGEVGVIITVPDTAMVGDGQWTDEEIKQMMQASPKTGAELAAMLDEMEAGFLNITDSASWVEAQRHSHRVGTQW